MVCLYMVNISIVTYNTSVVELDKCLSSLTSNKILNIYIVDNSNQEYIRSYCDNKEKVVYIPSTNVGYGSANNIAMRKSIDTNVKYHLVLNSDVYFTPNIIDEIVDYMDANEDIGQLIPNTIYPNGDIQYVCRTLPTPLDLLFRRFLPSILYKKRDIRHCLMSFNHKSIINVANHQGSFMFFRVDALKRIGLFDERYFMYAEDVDITRRMHKLYKTIFWPNVTIVHAHRAASYKSFKMMLIHSVNICRYFNKWGWLFDGERKKWNEALFVELNKLQCKDVINSNTH